MVVSEKEAYRTRLRTRLVHTTAELLAREGLAAAKARRIAEDADCSVGTLYNIFGDIDGLILAANEGTLLAIEQAMRAAMRRSTGRNLEARLLALATTYLDFATAHQQRWRAVFEHRPPEGYRLPEGYLAARRRLLDLLDTQLTEAIPDAAEREDAAFALLWGVHGIVLLSLDARLTPFDPARCERQIRFLVGRVAKGLG